MNITKRTKSVAAISSLAVLATLNSAPAAADPAVVFSLSGLQEVPAIVSDATGKSRVRVREGQGLVKVRVAFEDLSGDITQAHVHVAQAGANGGVAAWICVDPLGPSAGNAPAGTADCTGTSGEVSIDVVAQNVIGPLAQGVSPGDLSGLIAAIRGGAAYVNVHSTAYPSGEIRGQIVSATVEQRLDDIEEQLDGIDDDLAGHKHKYRTGKGKGHNNVNAKTSKPKY